MIDAVRDTTNDPLKVGEGILNFRPVAGDDEFSDSLVVPGTTHLEDVERTGHFAADLDVLQQENGVGNRRNMGVRNGVAPHEFLRGIGEEASDLFLLGVTGHTNHKLPEGVMTDASSQS